MRRMASVLSYRCLAAELILLVRCCLCCRVNYVEFWKTGPEDILEQLQWAKEHDQEAREIAQVGTRRDSEGSIRWHVWARA